MDQPSETKFIKDEEKFITDTEKYQKTNTLETYVVISVTGSGAFTAATTFFTSIMISKYSSFNPSVNIPTLFLIISTFGFLYATLIFANNIANLLNFNPSKFNKSRALGNALCEYLGIYFLMLSIPLIVNTISTDLFLRSAASIMDLGGLIIYHASGFSIMESRFGNKHWGLLLFILISEIFLVVFQFYNNFIFETVSAILVIFIFLVAFISRKSNLN